MEEKQRSYSVPTDNPTQEMLGVEELHYPYLYSEARDLQLQSPLPEGFLSPVSTQMFPCYRQFSRETNAEAERGDVGGQVVQSPGGMVDGQVVHSSVLAEIEGLIYGDVGGAHHDCHQGDLHVLLLAPVINFKRKLGTLSVTIGC